MGTERYGLRAGSSFRISSQANQGFEPGKEADPAENQRDPERNQEVRYEQSYLQELSDV